jgi:hypothetical protein
MATVDLDRLYAETMSKFDQLLPASGNQQPVKRQARPRNTVAAEKLCEFCRTSYPSRRLIHHHIVPEDIAQKVGLINNRTIELCFSCHRSLHQWNAKNVSWVRYQSEAKRHRAKSLAEVAKEYESTYMDFVEYNFRNNYGVKPALQAEPEVIG